MRAGPVTRWTGDGRTGESARRKPAAARFTAAAHRTPTWAATRRAATAAASTLPARRKAAHVGTRPTGPLPERSEEHTSELQSLMRISYAVFCLKKKTQTTETHKTQQ